MNVISLPRVCARVVMVAAALLPVTSVLARGPTPAASAPQGAEPLTRAQVAAQRAALTQRFASEQADCEQRFAVSGCMEALRLRRQAAFAPLVQRDHELAAEERKARSAAQVQRVRDREQAAAADEAEHRERLLTEPVPREPAMPASHGARGRSPEQAQQHQQQAEQRAASLAQQRQASRREREQRQQQRAQEHGQRLKQKGKAAAAPLPLPGAASAAR